MVRGLAYSGGKALVTDESAEKLEQWEERATQELPVRPGVRSQAASPPFGVARDVAYWSVAVQAPREGLKLHWR
jgi:hypothetical protein